MTGPAPHWWNEELDAFRRSVRQFIQTEIAPRRDGWRHSGRMDRDVWRAMGEMGMLCPSIPAEFGGPGGNFAHEAVVIEEIERGVPELSAEVQVHSTIMSHYILNFGSTEQKKRWLPSLASGDAIGAIAMTEPGTGSDLKAIKTRAVASSGGYVLKGQKTFITAGDTADLVIVVARTGEGKESALSLLVVDRRESKGVTSRRLDKIGMHASDTSEMFFDDVVVPRENLLGAAEGEGMRQLMAQLPRERLGIAVGAVAAMEKACELTAAYAKERKTFGTPIIEYQNTAFVLAQRKTETVIARVFIDHCVGQMLAGTFDGTAAAMAKMWTTDRLFDLLDDCVQIHGGNGYMEEYEIGRMLVDSRALRIYGGTNEIMKLIIARSL